MRKKAPELLGVRVAGPATKPNYIELDRLTILLGENGAGKSSLLRLIEREALVTVLGEDVPDLVLSDDYSEEDSVSFVVRAVDAAVVEQAILDLDVELPPAIADLLRGACLLEINRAWGAAVCLPPLKTLDAEQCAALAGWLDAQPTTSRPPWFPEADEDGPIPLLELREDKELRIEALAVPMGPERLQERIVSTARRLIEEHGLHARFVAPVPGAEGAVAPTLALRSFCGRLSFLATAFLSPILSGSSVRLRPMRVDRWYSSERPRLHIELLPEGESSGPDYERGPGGFRLWVELAVLEGLAAVTDRADVLETATHARSEMDKESYFDWLFGGGDSETSPDDVLSAYRASFTARILLLDEPEASLHPRAQRRLPVAMTDAASRGFTVLASTHSVELMRMEEPVRYYQVILDRAAGSSALLAIRPDELEALGAVAADLGLDRGQLMATVGLICFVEGTTDAGLLQAVAGTELRAGGVELIPLVGLKRAHKQGVVDSAWIKSGTWPLALLVDKLNAETVTRLQDDAEWRWQALRSSNTETQVVASVLAAATETGRTIIPLSHGFVDIFDLISDDVLAAMSADRGGKEAWPGHAAARARCGSDWKHAYVRRYALDPLAVSTYAEAGRRMRELGQVPQGLQRLVNRLLELSDRGGDL